MPAKIVSLFRNLLRKNTVEQALSDELQSSVDLLAEEKMKAGLSRPEAQRQALIELGGVEQVKEEVRSIRAGRLLEDLARDLRFAFRTLAKSTGFTAVAVLTLAIGISVNTAMFSSVNAMLLRPFLMKNSDRVVSVWETIPEQDEYHVSVAPANFRDWAEQAKGFDSLAAGHGWGVNLTGDDLAEHVEGYQVTENFFPLLGIAPESGRAIGADNFQPGHTSVVVLSHGFWQRHLGAKPDIVGQSLLLDGQKFTVIGIMPGDFDFPVGAEAWSPLDFDAAQKSDRADHYLHVVGRLKAGMSLSQAQADLQAVANRVAQQYPQTNEGHSVRVVNLVEDLTTGSRQFVLVLMGAAAFVLLKACANVANLMLARATAREKEIAVRLALGGSRWQVVRQLLTESILVACLGGLAGLVLCSVNLNLTRRSLPPFIVQHIAGLKHLTVDTRVLVFTFALAVLTGILAGLAPALQVSRPELDEALKEGTRGGTSSPDRRRVRGGLVVTQVAFALILLVGAGMMVRGFRNLAKSDQGFDAAHVLTFRVALSETKYRDKDRVRQFYDQVVDKLQSLPGVEEAAAVTSLPSSWSWNSTPFTGEGQPPARPGEMRTTISQVISPDFSRALRVPLLKGRTFAAQDGPDAPLVAIISQGLARRIWRDADPIGRRIKMGRADSNEPWRTIVGVVGDVKQFPFDRFADPTAYVPLDQMPQASSALVARTSGDPLALAAQARAVVKSVDPEQPAFDVRSQDQIISDNLSGVEYSARAMFVFAFVALALAASGIFALMSYSVAQRTHEIGVRMAMGARRADVLGLVVGQAFKLALVGLAIGVPCALAMSRALSGLLFGVHRIDVISLAGFTVVLALVAALAAYVPARAAAKVDPIVALRHE